MIGEERGPDTDALPRPEAWAALLLLRGLGAEFLVGDIVERFADDRESGVPVDRARSRLRRQIVVSALAWWSPSVILDRRRDARAAAETLVKRLSAPMSPPPEPRHGFTNSVLADVRPAVRGLLRRPSYTLAVGATLGLGIGAITTVFSVVDAVLLRPLPYEDPAALVTVGAVRDLDATTQSGDGTPPRLGALSWPDFDEIRRRTRSLSALAAIERIDFPLVDVGDGPEVAKAARISPEIFSLLGVSPALGRGLVPTDGSIDAERVALISYGAWQRRFGGQLDVIGQAIPRAFTRTTIVGILPAGFRAPEVYFPPGEEPEFWIALPADDPRYRRRDVANLLVVGRLAPAAGLDAARTELGFVAADVAAQHPATNRRPDGSPLGFGTNSLLGETVGGTGRPLAILFGAAAMLLLLSALNAGTLFLARSLDRSQELGVRSALGAGRGRVVRLLAVEGLLLAALGGAIGLAIAYGGVELFLTYAPASIPRLSSVSVDPRVLALAAVVSVGVGLASALVPALQTTRTGPWATIQHSGRGGTEPLSGLRTILVGGQVTAAVTLLAGAALLFSSFVNLRSVDPGFDPSGLLSMEIDMEGAARSFPDRWTTTWAGWDRALDEIASVPGIEAVAGTTDVPLRAPSWTPRVRVVGDSPDAWREGIAGYVVTPDYLSLVGTDIVAGRGLERMDGPESQAVVVVNQSFVRANFAEGVSAVGLEMRLQTRAGGPERAVLVVGVVEDAVQARIEDGFRPAIYVPYTQQAAELEAVVRMAAGPEAVIPELRRATAQFNPIIPLQDIRTLDARLADASRNQRFHALLVGAFSLVAILLAGAGLYASMTHAVGRRRRELAIRLAVGADRVELLTMVLRQGFQVAAVGVALGVAVAFALGRFLTRVLFEVDPQSPMILGAVAGTFLLVATIACLVPARRATAVDPVSVLKEG